VVDDGSSDGTAEAARAAGATVFSHPYNIGNGAAVKSGIRIASGGILVFMDGDGQHSPENITSLLECFPEYDMVVGARPGKGHSSWGRAVGNTIYNRLASYVVRFPVKDLTSGFRAVRAEIARNFVYLLPNTYSYPTTLTLAVLRSGRSVKYVPIKSGKRQAGTSNIGMFRDGVRFFLIIAKICTLFSPFRIFLPVSVFFFFLGTVYYGYTFFAYHRFTNMSALLLTTSILVFMMGLISEQICQMRYDRSEGNR
ncbi:MAG TPA: glycosyltransferase family 2 protein, partial [Desulfobacteraceae bacterium]|nr:glycosyltransferase family 2 protein [Desulfobacteraceae bacterium]